MITTSNLLNSAVLLKGCKIVISSAFNDSNNDATIYRIAFCGASGYKVHVEHLYSNGNHWETILLETESLDYATRYYEARLLDAELDYATK